MSCRLFLVDVFAERPYAGNPLAVVVAREPLPEPDMQAIAAEMNFSETTFVSPTAGADGAHRVAIFTPARRIDFAGHAILGTASVIRRMSGAVSSAPLHLRLDGGTVVVDFEASDLPWFTAPPIVMGPACPPAPIAHAVGLPIGDIEPRSPVQLARAGATAALIVPLRSRDALARCALDLGKFAPLAAVGFAPLVYLFCRHAVQPVNDLRARFFFDANGVREDPATGNGAAFLGAYLLEHGVLASQRASLRIEQGDEVRRPSLVRMRAQVADRVRIISVGGRVIPIAEGSLLRG